MRKGLLILTIVALVTGGIIAISGAGGDMPPADADKLWSYMTTDNPYTGWGFWPGHEGIYPRQKSPRRLLEGLCQYRGAQSGARGQAHARWRDYRQGKLWQG